MTTQEIIDYYSNLLIFQYVTKSKAYATIQALVRMVIADQIPVTVQNSFGLDDAVGVQLDVIGKYSGVTRNDYTFSGPVTLSDSDFRTLIKMAIVRNASGSSLSDIQKLIAMFFPGDILVFDYQNMRMDYFFDSAIGSSDLAEIFVKSGVLPKPMGVQLGSLVYSANITNFFGFRTYNLAGFNVSPFNSYADYQTDWPWLSYTDAISA